MEFYVANIFNKTSLGHDPSAKLDYDTHFDLQTLRLQESVVDHDQIKNQRIKKANVNYHWGLT